MKNNIRRYSIISTVSIIQFIMTAYFYETILGFMVTNFSAIKYIDNHSFKNPIPDYIIILVCCILTTIWNIKTLESISKLNFLQFALMFLADIIIVPLGFLIMIWYNNSKKGGIVYVESIINVYLILLLISIKHIVILIAYKKLSFGGSSKKRINRNG